MPLTGSRAAEALVGYRGETPAPARRPRKHAPFEKPKASRNSSHSRKGKDHPSSNQLQRKGSPLFRPAAKERITHLPTSRKGKLPQSSLRSASSLREGALSPVFHPAAKERTFTFPTMGRSPGGRRWIRERLCKAAKAAFLVKAPSPRELAAACG